MTYTITINSNSTEAKNLVNYIKTFDFAEVTKTKATKQKTKATIVAPAFSQEVLEASQVLKMTPEEIVAAAEEEEMTPDDYAWSMMISKKINHNIAKRWDEYFNI